MSSVFLQRAFLQTLTQLFAWSKVHFEVVEVTDSLHYSSFFGLANFACRVLERNRKKGTTMETVGTTVLEVRKCLECQACKPSISDSSKRVMGRLSL